VQGFNPVAVQQQQQPQYFTIPAELPTVDKVQFGQQLSFEQQPPPSVVYSHPYQPVQQPSFEAVQQQQPTYVQAVAVDPAAYAQHLLAQQVPSAPAVQEPAFPIHQQQPTGHYVQPVVYLQQQSVDPYHPQPIQHQIVSQPPLDPSSYVHQQQPIQQAYVQQPQVAPHQLLNQTPIDPATVAYVAQQQPIQANYVQPAPQPVVDPVYLPQPTVSYVQQTVQQQPVFQQPQPVYTSPVEQEGHVQQVPEQPQQLVYAQPEQLPPVAQPKTEVIHPAAEVVEHHHPDVHAIQNDLRSGTPDLGCGQCNGEVCATDSCGESSAAESFDTASSAPGGALPAPASNAASLTSGESNNKRLNRRPTKKARRPNGPRLTVLSVQGSVVEYQLEAMKQKTVTFKFDQTDTVPADVANHLIQHGHLSEQHSEVFIEQVNRTSYLFFHDLLANLFSLSGGRYIETASRKSGSSSCGGSSAFSSGQRIPLSQQMRQYFDGCRP